MSQLISSYQSIERLIKKLTISEKKYSQIEQQIKQAQLQRHYTHTLDEFKKTKLKIMQSIRKTNIKYYTELQDIGKGIIEVNGIYNVEFLFGFQIFVKVKFMFFSSQIGVYVTLLRNSKPFRILHKANKLMINKFVLKINSFIPQGAFKLDPITGQFALVFTTILSSLQFNNLIDPIPSSTTPYPFSPQYPYRNQNSSILAEFIENELTKAKIYLNSYFCIILHLINQLPQNYQKYPQIEHNKYRYAYKAKTVSRKFMEIQQTINKIVPIMSFQFPFMFSEITKYTGSRVYALEEIQKMVMNVESAKKLEKIFSQEIMNIFKILSQNKNKHKIPNKLQDNKKNDNQQKQQFNQKQKFQFASALIEPIPKNQNNQIINVYSEIQIISGPTFWEIIDQGGFGIISKGVVKFVEKRNNGYENNNMNNNLGNKNQQNMLSNNINNVITKIIVKKQDLQNSGKRVNHQKQILTHLSKNSSHFIAKYYYSKQNQFKNSLLIEYCAQKCLRYVRARCHEFMSLSTKLYYLCSIAQGIKFLKDRQIYHLDIKPTNILVTAGATKLIDFGESYCNPRNQGNMGMNNRTINLNHKPGTTIPYAPHQCFDSRITFNYKMDIFSFGVVMYELLYDTFPFDYTRNKYEYFRKMYTNKKYPQLIQQAPERTSRQGYLKIHYILKFLALKCLEIEEKRRPCVEWIIIILKQCINMEGMLYV